VATEEAVADPALRETGLAAYRAQYCGICHTLDAAETRGTFGPPHNGMGEIAAARLLEENYSGSATTAAEYIHESIVEPQVYIAPGYATTSHRMPTYAHLDSATVDALVAFLLAQ
jgi:mono/diheme cytochrome c family protein